jgi:hypothetical protein
MGTSTLEQEPVSTQSPGMKRCPECKRTVEANSMRPLSRSSHGGGLRYACPACYARVWALRKVARDAARNNK